MKIFDSYLYSKVAQNQLIWIARKTGFYIRFFKFFFSLFGAAVLEEIAFIQTNIYKK